MIKHLIVFGIALQVLFPVPKIGDCPKGYNHSGDYCNPPPRERRQAVPKIGQCPSTHNAVGEYCVPVRAAPEYLIAR